MPSGRTVGLVAGAVGGGRSSDFGNRTGYVVRAAVGEDVGTAAALLGRVFESYPWTTWTVEESDRRQRLSELYQVVLDSVAVPFATAWVCDLRDQGCSELVGAAGWLSPTADPPAAVWRELVASEVRLRGNRLDAHLAAEAQLEAVRPKGPHWFLGTVGVLPRHRGRGVAATLLRPGLRAAAADGLEAYLETSRVDNLSLYQRLGFEVSAVVDIVAGGPTVWCMRRRT
jgi:ribosomal protein S18 acetylase RimI-like enzyme